MTPASPPLSPPASPLALFTALSLLAMQAFGGALAFAQDMMCEKRRWLSQQQFVEMVAIAQLMPGPNMGNLCLVVGDHFFGLRGALAAIAGLLIGPVILALSLAAFFGGFMDQPLVAGALKGIGAVAAGMIIGNALRLARSLRGNPMGLPVCVGITVVAFASAGLLRVSLMVVIPVVGGLAWWWAWRTLRALHTNAR